jgi:hypothetical protein
VAGSGEKAIDEFEIQRPIGGASACSGSSNPIHRISSSGGRLSETRGSRHARRQDAVDRSKNRQQPELGSLPSARQTLAAARTAFLLLKEQEAIVLALGDAPCGVLATPRGRS